MFKLTDKNAVITGAASGIGKACALVFAQQGATVHLLDMNTLGLTETVAEITESGGIAVQYITDVTPTGRDQILFKKIGKIDILVNCAGISNIGRADTTSEEDFDHVFKVNVKGMYNCLHEVIPMMKENNGGVILNMASIAASLGLADRFAYSMSKGAVLGMTLSVAKDYINDGIRCNSISPARVHTPFVDNFPR
jgi:NAD(P)-dependent dehydrogenase (short-subunit alcohol dehydrogenase family)